MVLFEVAHGLGGGCYGGIKIFHTYPTMMKLGTIIPYLNKIQKYKKHGTDHVSTADINNIPSKIRKFCFIMKYRYISHFNT